VKGDELNVWLCADTGTWVLKDTVSVKETCINFIKKEPEMSVDGDDVPMEMGPEPLANGGDAPMEEMGPDPPADGGDEPIYVAPEPPTNGGGMPIDVVGVGDNAKFVFLELGNSGAIIYLHIESKKVRKVYQRDPTCSSIHHGLASHLPKAVWR
jgi:hypothetical protein